MMVLAMLAMIGPAAAETVQLYAAGSLRGALTEIAKVYESSTGNKVEAKYGPSGLLKTEISAGAKVDVFASANMEHPQALHDDKKSGPVLRFAGNRLCALVRPGLTVDSANLLEHMLDPNVKLGTSTPKADPSGDYAFEVFRKAGAIRPGAQAILERKALQLTGGAGSASPPAGRTVYGWHVAEGRADIFLTYCTNAQTAQKEGSGQQIVPLPDNLAVGADYGLTVIAEASSSAQQFAEFIMSSQGQQILTSHGFAAGKPGAHRMKLSARNQLKGKIVEVKKGATTAHVRIDIGGQTITASITNESADELKLENGKTAYAIIKATSVMVGVD
jgi:molybdate transport system substrate-binding protein